MASRSKGPARGETSNAVKRTRQYSSDDIHRAIFAATPKARSAEEMKAGIARHMREKHARR